VEAFSSEYVVLEGLKMKTLCIVVLLISAALTGYGTEDRLPRRSDSLSFEKRINLIDAKVVDLTDIFALHHIEEFNEVYLTPLKFEDSVTQYLGQPVNLEHKLIAVCSMTALPLSEYIKMLNVYYSLYQKKLIDEGSLNCCIFNEFDTKNRLARQYKNPLIRTFLSKVLKDRSLPKDFRTNLRETLSGKWYSDLKTTGHL
jgi:hypothetical protein